MEISSCAAGGLAFLGFFVALSALSAIFLNRRSIGFWFKKMWDKFIYPLKNHRPVYVRLAYAVFVLAILGTMFVGIRSVPKPPEISVYDCEPKEETTAFFDCGCGD